MIDIQLKGCPFCGGEAEMNAVYDCDSSYIVDAASVDCQECEAGTYYTFRDSSDFSKDASDKCIQDAVDHWNKRTGED